MRRGFSALIGVLLISSAGRAQVKPCCAITAIDARSETATARENATSRVFAFKVPDARLFASLRVGQGVYANFTSHQVSIDGRTACCSIVSISSSPAPTPPTGSAPNRTPSPANGSAPQNAGRPDAAKSPNSPGQDASSKKPGIVGALAAGASGAKPNAFSIPSVSFGAPQTLQGSGTLSTSLRGSQSAVNPNVVRLHGINGIATATGIPQAAKDFLIMHARTLPPGEVDNYVVNAQLAEEWFRTHPEPESVKKASAKSDSHAGCNAISVHCAGEAAQHAADEAARQSQKLLEEAQAEWSHVTSEVEHDWNMAQGCFVDNRLTLPGIPVKFSVTPQFPMNFQRNGTTSNESGSASGTISGSVVFGVPIQSDFTAQVDMFYIPCLPFAVRPRSIAASGNLGVGSTFDASATATGNFNQTFTIPPTGGPHFPIEVIPIVIAGVPVAELDVSVYVDGRVLVDGQGKVAGAMSVKTMQDTAFDFACGGNACDLNQRSVPEPITTTESARIDGRVHVKPEVYAALQLDFDVDLLTARAGPQPYLLGEIYGCAAASATQSAGQPTGGQDSYALTSDLDWGIELRAEALVAEKKVAEKDWKLLQRHLYFKDLANSTALIPMLSGAAQPSPGQPAVYSMKMPACYPYPDPLEYQVSWTGGAAASDALVPPTSSTNGKLSGASLTKLVGKPVSKTTGSTPPTSCTLQAGGSQCWGDPVSNLALGLTWPTAGSFAVSAMPLRDQHGRRFDPPRTAQVTVSVQPPGATPPAADTTSEGQAAAVASPPQTAPVAMQAKLGQPSAISLGQQKANGGTQSAPLTQVPNLIFQNLQSIRANLVAASNPNQLPDLVPALSPSLHDCTYTSAQTCPQQCPPFTMTIGLGVKNLTPYAVSGAIGVLLQDTSGHTVRSWIVNGLAGSAEAYPGSYSYQAEYYCPTPGTQTLTISPTPPNYVLMVTAPNGVSEFRTDNNSAQIYIRPDAKISP